MDAEKILGMLQRMEFFLERGIQIAVEPRDPSPVVLIKVQDPNDYVFVPEITELALALWQENNS